MCFIKTIIFYKKNVTIVLMLYSYVYVYSITYSQCSGQNVACFQKLPVEENKLKKDVDIEQQQDIIDHLKQSLCTIQFNNSNQLTQIQAILTKVAIQHEIALSPAEIKCCFAHFFNLQLFKNNINRTQNAIQQYLTELSNENLTNRKLMELQIELDKFMNSAVEPDNTEQDKKIYQLYRNVGCTNECKECIFSDVTCSCVDLMLRCNYQKLQSLITSIKKELLNNNQNDKIPEINETFIKKKFLNSQEITQINSLDMVYKKQSDLLEKISDYTKNFANETKLKKYKLLKIVVCGITVNAQLNTKIEQLCDKKKLLQDTVEELINKNQYDVSNNLADLIPDIYKFIHMYVFLHKKPEDFSQQSQTDEFNILLDNLQYLQQLQSPEFFRYENMANIKDCITNVKTKLQCYDEMIDDITKLYGIDVLIQSYTEEQEEQVLKNINQNILYNSMYFKKNYKKYSEKFYNFLDDLQKKINNNDYLLDSNISFLEDIRRMLIDSKSTFYHETVITLCTVINSLITKCYTSLNALPNTEIDRITKQLDSIFTEYTDHIIKHSLSNDNYLIDNIRLTRDEYFKNIYSERKVINEIASHVCVFTSNIKLIFSENYIQSQIELLVNNLLEPKSLCNKEEKKILMMKHVALRVKDKQNEQKKDIMCYIDREADIYLNSRQCLVFDLDYNNLINNFMLFIDSSLQCLTDDEQQLIKNDFITKISDKQNVMQNKINKIACKFINDEFSLSRDINFTLPDNRLTDRFIEHIDKEVFTLQNDQKMLIVKDFETRVNNNDIYKKKLDVKKKFDSIKEKISKYLQTPKSMNIDYYLVNQINIGLEYMNKNSSFIFTGENKKNLIDDCVSMLIHQPWDDQCNRFVKFHKFKRFKNHLCQKGADIYLYTEYSNSIINAYKQQNNQALDDGHNGLQQVTNDTDNNSNTNVKNNNNNLDNFYNNFRTILSVLTIGFCVSCATVGIFHYKKKSKKINDLHKKQTVFIKNKQSSGVIQNNKDNEENQKIVAE